MLTTPAVPRRSPLLLIITILALAAMFPGSAASFDREASRVDAEPHPLLLASDCTLDAYDSCSGWLWVFDDVEGAVWGAVLDPNDCPAGCLTGGAVTSIVFYSQCGTTPATFGGVGVSRVDAVGCRTAMLYDSGPLTIVHCIAGNRWTTFDTPIVHLFSLPFAVTVTWGPQISGGSNLQFATDNGIANLYCSHGVTGTFPGCATTEVYCSGWTLPAQNTYIYVTDANGDGSLDDICALYGAPYPLSFPYQYPYGYLPNNLVVAVGLDCSAPGGAEPTSWGRVKSLFQ